MSGRCVSCNKILKDTELFWIEDRKTHNDMCGSCRTKSKSYYYLNEEHRKARERQTISEIELWEAYLATIEQEQTKEQDQN
jgi:hypothetical protein